MKDLVAGSSLASRSRGTTALKGVPGSSTLGSLAPAAG